jgi:hypothetical protein
MACWGRVSWASGCASGRGAAGKGEEMVKYKHFIVAGAAPQQSCDCYVDFGHPHIAQCVTLVFVVV